MRSAFRCVCALGCVRLAAQSKKTSRVQIVLLPNNSEPLKRPIHLDGIQLERDGELNKEFRQEVLLGGNPKDSDELKEMVKKMFEETDINKDGFLSIEELEERIVSWEEYEPHYLSKESQNDGHEHKTLGDRDNSLAGPERDSFNRADVNGDGSLDPEEWL
ncbi:EF hand, partial [Ancylostoma duodenale]